MQLEASIVRAEPLRRVVLQMVLYGCTVILRVEHRSGTIRLMHRFLFSKMMIEDMTMSNGHVLW